MNECIIVSSIFRMMNGRIKLQYPPSPFSRFPVSPSHPILAHGRGRRQLRRDGLQLLRDPRLQRRGIRPLLLGRGRAPQRLHAPHDRPRSLRPRYARRSPLTQTSSFASAAPQPTSSAIWAACLTSSRPTPRSRTPRCWSPPPAS